VSKLHVVSREIYGIGVVQVSGILGIGLPPRHAGRGTSYYRGGPIYRAPVSDRDLFDAPSRTRTHHPLAQSWRTLTSKATLKNGSPDSKG